MTEMIKSYLDKINIGAEQSYKNLAMFPLLSGYSIPCNYLTMDEAFSNDMIERSPIARDNSVPELKVINKSNEMVLISDGEKSAGAKQNRSVSKTILNPVKETVEIPEKCGEHSQWSCNTNRNTSNERVAASWNYIEQFARVDGQIGAIFLINGKIAGTVCFSGPEAFKISFIKIVECHAKKAAYEFDPTMDLKSSKSEVINFLKTPNDFPIETNRQQGWKQSLAFNLNFL